MVEKLDRKKLVFLTDKIDQMLERQELERARRKKLKLVHAERVVELREKYAHTKN